MRRFLLGLYPEAWRTRYGDEFETLLEERPLGPFDVADVLLAALDAQLHLRGFDAAGDQSRGVLMTLRVGGFAAIAGGVLWLLAMGAAALANSQAQLWIVLFGMASTAQLVGLIGLSAFQARRDPLLVWAAVVLPAAGAIGSLVGVIGMAIVGDRPMVAGVSPWYVWVVGLMALIVGSGLFALATLRARTLSRSAAALLAISAVAILPGIFGVAYSNGPGDVGNILAILGIGGFAGGWIWLGVSAVRLDRPLANTYSPT